MTSGNRVRIVVVVAAVVALLGVAAAVQLLRGGDDELPAGLTGVKTYTDLKRDHVQGTVDYPQHPPVGGPHDSVWLNCGVYDEPVRDENAVHALEHGAVWITYRPGLSADEIEGLEAKLPDKGILSPYDDQDAPVVVTAWGEQLALDGPDDPRLDLFIDEYSDGHTSPEPEVTCQGGVERFADDDGNA